MRYILHLGDCIEKMREMESNSIDAVVTDPPYELGFMGRAWDSTGIANRVDLWAEVLRVLKPGGHLLAFSGSRTYHRMTCAIEDSGFEVRDQIMWLYGSGFPKSLDVSKAIDKAAGAERETVARVRSDGKATGQEASGFMGGAGSVSSTTSTVGVTPDAKQWEGWGTALKPAHEPIVVARKPLAGTVAANVLAHGTGAINIDASRVETDERIQAPPGSTAGSRIGAQPSRDTGYEAGTGREYRTGGRWPANVIHDGSDEVIAAFPEIKTGALKTWVTTHVPETTVASLQKGLKPGSIRFADHAASDGSAARFFYCAKAAKDDREDWNIHPTVKPTALMRHLVRLITPPGGLVLDPFMGSGSTGKAAALEGFSFVGIEREAEYIAIARRRIEAASAQGDMFNSYSNVSESDSKMENGSLFDDSNPLILNDNLAERTGLEPATPGVTGPVSE